MEVNCPEGNGGVCQECYMLALCPSVLRDCATKWDLSDLKFHLNDFTLTHCTVHLSQTLNIKHFDYLYT